jgi:cytidylate kinase
MCVITVSREVGSGGDGIAKQVAETLGYHLVDKEWLGTLLNQYGLVEFDREYDTLPSFWERFNAQREQRRDLMVTMLNRVVRAVAYHGNAVILGRSGFAILGGLDDVLNVRFQAPLASRVSRVMAQQQIGAAEAEAIVKEGDRVRSGFVESFYGVPWPAATAFDLVINTDKVASHLAGEWLVTVARALEARAAEAKTAYDTMEIDPILSAAVSAALGCQVIHRS